MPPSLAASGAGTFYNDITTTPFTAANVGGSGGVRVAVWTWITRTVNPATSVSGSFSQAVSAGWTSEARSFSSTALSASIRVGVTVAVKVGGSDVPTLTMTPQVGFSSGPHRGTARMYRVAGASLLDLPGSQPTAGGGTVTPLAEDSLAFVVASVRSGGGGGNNLPPMVEAAANGWTLIENEFYGGTPVPTYVDYPAAPGNWWHATHIWARLLTGGGSAVNAPLYNNGDFSFNNGYQIKVAFHVTPPAPPESGIYVGHPIGGAGIYAIG